MTSLSSISIRDFNSTETGEINTYISANVPYSVLQTIFPLTENAMQKAKVFTIVYRIINGAKNYAEEESLRDKIETLLKESETVYLEVYALISSIEGTTLYYGSHVLQRRLRAIFEDSSKNMLINKLIDAFLVFAEKITRQDTNKVAGLEMDTEEGREMYKKINLQDEIQSTAENS